MEVQLQQLSYFVAVARTRNFTRAAADEHVAQPSLSKQIRVLEAELGAPLFSRARGNVTLTTAGETLLPIATRILADVARARIEVGEIAQLARGRLHLGATPSLTTVLLPEVFSRFRHAYPRIELVIEEGGSRDLVRLLAQGELDLALIILPLQRRDPALVTDAILREELVAAAAPSVRLPTTTMRVRDLRRYAFVMFREGYDLREVTLAALRDAGVDPEFAIEGGEMDAVLRFTEAGLGVAVLPSMVVEGRPLRAVKLSPALSRTIALARRRDVESSRVASAFRATLLEYLDAAATAGRLPVGVTPAQPLQNRSGRG